MLLFLNVEKVLYSLWPFIVSLSFFTKVFTKICLNICYSRHKKIEVINGFLTYQRTFLCFFFFFGWTRRYKIDVFHYEEWFKPAMMCRYLLNMTRFWLQLFIVKIKKGHTYINGLHCLCSLLKLILFQAWGDTTLTEVLTTAALDTITWEDIPDHTRAEATTITITILSET